MLLHAPQERYTKRDSVQLNNHGAGPFCEFRLRGLPHSSGVYVYLLRGEPVYVGQPVDLDARFYAYRRISPKNCYRGGRETNCRMNTLIYNTYASGESIDVYVHVTQHYARLEGLDDFRSSAEVESKRRDLIGHRILRISTTGSRDRTALLRRVLLAIPDFE